jgi:hypothetical protein
MLLTQLPESQSMDLLEIIEARHEVGSIIFSSQFFPSGLYGKISSKTLFDTILNRIVHNSYKIKIE